MKREHFKVLSFAPLLAAALIFATPKSAFSETKSEKEPAYGVTVKGAGKNPFDQLAAFDKALKKNGVGGKYAELQRRCVGCETVNEIESVKQTAAFMEAKAKLTELQYTFPKSSIDKVGPAFLKAWKQSGQELQLLFTEDPPEADACTVPPWHSPCNTNPTCRYARPHDNSNGCNTKAYPTPCKDGTYCS
jgi:hypothetical protein